MPFLQGFARRFFPIYWISWKSSEVPFEKIGNAPTQQQRSQLAKEWKAGVLHQHSNVEIIGAIFLAVIASGFTWPAIERMQSKSLAALQVFWFSSLMFSIAAVAVAVHQSVFLTRLASIPDYEEVLVQILTYDGPTGKRVPRQEQTFIWLLAVALLEWSLGFWLGGYAVFIWDVTKVGQKGQNGLNIMVASITLVTLIVSTLVYFFSVSMLWTRLNKSKNLIGL